MSYAFNSPWISVEQALMELENINKEHGIIGVIDAKGNFVYVSMEIMKKAIQVGRDAGRVLLHHGTKTWLGRDLYRDLSSRHGRRSNQEFIEHAFFH
mmetsp:Transcript_36234/g.76145  ORF Transcript_36234/g.76145 Transcript_36234/m.76145 type:complete len:97 (+) Transcript_36234:727-1017(+)